MGAWAFKNGDDCWRITAALAGLENELLIVESIAEVGMPAIKNIKGTCKYVIKNVSLKHKMRHHVSCMQDMTLKQSCGGRSKYSGILHCVECQLVTEILGEYRAFVPGPNSSKTALTLHMQALCSPKMSINTYLSTRHNTAQDLNFPVNHLFGKGCQFHYQTHESSQYETAYLPKR